MDTDAFDRLPNLDSPTLDQELVAILCLDRVLLLDLDPLIESFTWPERMAIGLVAYHEIDPTHTQLIKLAPAHGEFSRALKEAIELVKKLSPQALAELAVDILSEDFELGPVNAKTDDDDDDDDGDDD